MLKQYETEIALREIACLIAWYLFLFTLPVGFINPSTNQFHAAFEDSTGGTTGMLVIMQTLQLKFWIICRVQWNNEMPITVAPLTNQKLNTPAFYGVTFITTSYRSIIRMIVAEKMPM